MTEAITSASAHNLRTAFAGRARQAAEAFSTLVATGSSEPEKLQAQSDLAGYYAAVALGLGGQEITDKAVEDIAEGLEHVGNAAHNLRATLARLTN